MEYPKHDELMSMHHVVNDIANMGKTKDAGGNFRPMLAKGGRFGQQTDGLP